ncbi:PhnD/SsuA/transferrin family substrate-binding protein [Candidatus Latescibacterota bacterium]
MESREPFVDFTSNEKLLEPETQLDTGNNSLRFAVATMVSAEPTFSTYRDLVHKISIDVGRNESFILRPSYKDVRTELEKANVDVALVCTGTYVHTRSGKRVKLLVQPEFENGIDYRGMIIVPANSTTRTIEDLRGKVMAFTDPESHTGFVVPTVAVADLGYSVQDFFKKIIFTDSHDRSIRAVALGVVDGAGIMSLVWDSLLLKDPLLSDSVKIIWRSEPFGPPSIVVPVGLDKNLEESLLQAFLSLNETQEGREILSTLRIKRFVPGRDEDYQTAVKLYDRFKTIGDSQWP